MNDNPTANRTFYQVSRLAIWTLGAAALGYLIFEHRPHLFGWLPYLIILACPLMHLFMHHGHHHGGHSSGRSPKGNDAGNNSSPKEAR